jgi:hypothetical protein
MLIGADMARLAMTITIGSLKAEAMGNISYIKSNP